MNIPYNLWKISYTVEGKKYTYYCMTKVMETAISEHLIVRIRKRLICFHTELVGIDAIESLGKCETVEDLP